MICKQSIHTKKGGVSVVNHDDIKEAQREYYRNYYKCNKERIRQRQNEWRRANKDKVAEYNQRHWKQKAIEKK